MESNDELSSGSDSDPTSMEPNSELGSGSHSDTIDFDRILSTKYRRDSGGEIDDYFVDYCTMSDNCDPIVKLFRDIHNCNLKSVENYTGGDIISDIKFSEKWVCPPLIWAVASQTRHQRFNFEIIEYLLKHGADINRFCVYNNRRKTCLMVAAGYLKLMEFLISKGADVNARSDVGLTALHYTIKTWWVYQFTRFECVKMLLDKGSKYHWEGFNNNVMKYAAIMGLHMIVEYFIQNTSPTDADIIDALELLGAQEILCFPHRTHTIHFTATMWKRAMKTRHKDHQQPIKKKLPLETKEMFEHKSEPVDMNQLNQLLAQEDDLISHSFLIGERVLGEGNPEFIRFLLGTLKQLNETKIRYGHGAKLADYALSSCAGCSCSSRDILRLYQWEAKFWSEDISTVKNLKHGLNMLKTLLDMLTPGTKLNDQMNSFGSHIMTLMVVIIEYIFLFIKWLEADEAQLVEDGISVFDDPNFNTMYVDNCGVYNKEWKAEMMSQLHAFCGNASRINPINETKSTLLHYALDPSTIGEKYKIEYEAIDCLELFLPNLRLTSLLLDAGFDVNARDIHGDTCLMTALSAADWRNRTLCDQSEYKHIIEALINADYHCDIRSKKGKTYQDSLPENLQAAFGKSDVLPLQCLAARAVTDYQVYYSGLVPSPLDHLIKMHDCCPDRDYNWRLLLIS